MIRRGRARTSTHNNSHEPRKAYQRSRDEFIFRLEQTLGKDERFAAAWIYGSLGRGDGDALSDVDLALVVKDEYSETLCRRPWMTSAQTTPERLELFRRFGEPALIHENNPNAAPGGTFTFTLYAGSHIMVDWSLRPLSGAQRPPDTRLLFDHAGIPEAAPTSPWLPADLPAYAAEKAAFFWMMSAITAKYLYRGKRTFVLAWLGRLAEMVEELERIYGVKTPQVDWITGSSRRALAEALRGLCARMAGLSQVGMNTVAQVEVERFIDMALRENP